MTSMLPPEDGPLVPDTRKRWLVIVAVWTGIALFFSLQDSVRFAMRGQPLEWWVIRSEVAYWWLWIPLTPLALAAVRRFWITRENRWRTIAIHCAIALIVGFLHECGLIFLLHVTRDNPVFVPATANMPPIDVTRIPVGMLTGFYKYWALIGVYSAFVYARRTRTQQVHSAQLETRLAQAELQALRMQLHPHFLFNTLHAVSMLNFSDVDAANRMLVRLSDLLRMSLVNAGRQHVRLSEEMDFLRKYLEIEQTRFHDRLRVDIDVDEQLLDAEVPNLVLQPLVENAIRHGVSRSSQPGTIEISVQRSGNDVVLKVCDNGPGISMPFDPEEHAGIGLSTTITRLRQLYGAHHRFSIGPRSEGGTCAEIVFPYYVPEAT
jgi:two-component system, LytTR family, sensor kinase